MRRIAISLLLLVAAAPRIQNHLAPASHARALDRCVAAPDATFSCTAVTDLPATGATGTLLDMASQRWLTERKVQQPGGSVPPSSRRRSGSSPDNAATPGTGATRHVPVAAPRS